MLGHFRGVVPESRPRQLTGVPVEYPTASSPQAWATGTPLLLLRAMLGLEPGNNAPLSDPELPNEIESVHLDGVPGRWNRLTTSNR